MTTHSIHSGGARPASRRARWLILPAAAALFFSLAAMIGSGSNGGAEARDGTLLGNAVAVGNGTARVYITMDDRRPVELGVALSEAALTGLTQAGAGTHAHGSMKEYLLPLPEENPTPFKLMELDWNPAGHEPPGIYDRPHFDFHFYTISLEERNAITPEDSEFQAKSARHPKTGFVPAGYVPGPVVPHMGVHWFDPTTPELNGKPFTTTFIYGSWDGRLTFAEPMITKAFIESKPDFRAPVAMAEKYEVAGYYPSSYRIYWDEATREYRIALTGLVQKR